jgi:diguanylate cyclase (GGDEF)-like protein
MQGLKRILFVDDEPLARNAFADSLQDRDFQVDVADGGDEALGLASQHPYAVVAADWRMPRIDGLELIQRIRPKLPDATYLLVTGAPAELACEPERISRIDGVIAKPWTRSALASAMERAVELYWTRRSRKSVFEAEKRTRRVLLVEDNAGDAVLVSKQLGKVANAAYEVVHSERLADAVERLRRGSFEVALVDLSLPDARGLEIVQQLQGTAPSLPIVVLSGFDDEPLALQAVSAGAQDYLVKGEAGPRLLHRAIRYAVERKLAADRLVYLAHHDQLTGLSNRSLFRERLSRAISQARRAAKRVAVLFLDLDHFKAINDSLGHDVGDVVLQGVARRIKAAVRDADTIARVGGDEFAIVIDKLDDENHAPALAQRILDTLAKPFHFNGREIVISASVGISFFPDNGDNMGQLLRAADSAMYRAKEIGRNAYQFFNEETHCRMVERMQLEIALRGAAGRDEFLVYYQPQLDLRTGRLRGVEALLRWEHGERGFVPPARFIPLLEQTGLIVGVGEWLLRRACSQASRWRRRGFPELRVAVNLSPRQFEDGKIVDAVERALEEADGEAQFLELDITERVLMLDAERTSRTLERLKELGVRIAIDDFGTGYSSLSDLRRFPIDSLKIDRSFVNDMAGEGGDQRSLAGAIIALAHQLRIEVIAEGVETSEQLSKLEECDGMQGFLYSPPCSVEELSTRLPTLDRIDVASLKAGH